MECMFCQQSQQDPAGSAWILPEVTQWCCMLWCHWPGPQDCQWVTGRCVHGLGRRLLAKDNLVVEVGSRRNRGGMKRNGGGRTSELRGYEHAAEPDPSPFPLPSMSWFCASKIASIGLRSSIGSMGALPRVSEQQFTFSPDSSPTIFPHHRMLYLV